MTKTLFKTAPELEAWKANEAQGWEGFPGEAARLLKSVVPESFPAVLAFSWEECPDNGLFTAWEFVYPSDFA